MFFFLDFIDLRHCVSGDGGMIMCCYIAEGATAKLDLGLPFQTDIYEAVVQWFLLMSKIMSDFNAEPLRGWSQGSLYA